MPLASRYKLENGVTVVEVGVTNCRQLFNDRDPAPFRERDLDPQFVTYLVSAIEEFSIAKKMKLRVLTADEADTITENSATIIDAIHAFFAYESTLAKAKLRKRLRTARYFCMIGFITLFLSLSAAELIGTINVVGELPNIISVGFVIIGWVAMWHPVEALLYEWWPIREQRLYFDKISVLDVEIVQVRCKAASPILKLKI